MIHRIWFTSLLFSLGISSSLFAQRSNLKSPDGFLPYPLGSRFTPHHLLVDYFQYVDHESDNVKVIQYGQTYEYRPLIAAIISSPQNMQRLDDIRLNNLRRTGTITGDIIDDSIAIVYLSFSIHGNEAAGSESSMAVLYALANGGEPYDSWLKHTVVIIDPSLNPDGYTRFSQFSNSISSIPADPRHEVREHDEPWPGGRFNHYVHDLNRDWAWQTQQETRDRVAFYLQWMPHVHADLHEMEAEASYYFAPAAQPYHPYFTTWQAEFQKIIGYNHARHFDEKGWRYYTKERFDLFYPGYGDTYPGFAGAIGMTYEQGGAAFGNKALLLDNGDTLTLADRIAHHALAALSTIEVSAQHAAELTKQFALYFHNSISDPPGPVNSYVIPFTNPPGKISELMTLLKLNGIRWGFVKEDKNSIKGFSYVSGDHASFNITKGDLLVPAAQPRSALLQALFEPEGKLSDSLTYDITAWSLPLAFGLDAYATEDFIGFTPLQDTLRTVELNDPHPVAYAIQWGSVPSTQLLVSILEHGMVARYALEPFTAKGVSYDAGTILLMRSDNERYPQFDQAVRTLVSGSVVPVSTISTGYVEIGKDLGSNYYPLVRKPEVLALSGDEVYPTSFGEVWQFFEEELHYPLHIINVSALDNMDLSRYNQLILNEGHYNFKEETQKRINDWVNNGGRLVAIGAAINSVVGKNGFSIKHTDKANPDSMQLAENTTPKTYSSGARDFITEDIQGAIFKTEMDKSNPLSFGLGQTYWTLKTNLASYSWLKDDQNALYLGDDPMYFGFAGAKALEKIDRTLVAGEESHGNGTIVYLVDNPLFRSFWNNGKVLFSNVLFF
ncbi:MAG TPA: M14 family metallopeptidase [Saprospiraceae bacterium]|nr:M14 family metallopeptidase [Saprospiraceae bacterium]